MKEKTLIWLVYFDLKDMKEHAFQITEEEKKIPLNNLLKKHIREEATFITMQIAFTEEEAIRKFPRL